MATHFPKKKQKQKTDQSEWNQLVRREDQVATGERASVNS